MSNIAIYYQLNKIENTDQAVNLINNLIEQLQSDNVIMGVFLELYGESNEFNRLINSPLIEVDYIYISKHINDEFDYQLLKELSKTEQFTLKFYNEI